ncbi:CLUMA_CG019484, isoform A [Clunio marinus]|uniref:CLUMA_CG019484, isoform A n=1 Tax=Clunio marinus TaxID=568069 RepID=A0A1J1J407_9DIPT|nr:CLUMA_CG019484, isoform A [Clunio marinus]
MRGNKRVGGMSFGLAFVIRYDKKNSNHQSAEKLIQSGIICRRIILSLVKLSEKNNSNSIKILKVVIGCGLNFAFIKTNEFAMGCRVDFHQFYFYFDVLSFSIFSMVDKQAASKPHEMNNRELVRLYMAATPSYFFTPPSSLHQAGHNFFFSEMLKSLVQKRKSDELNSTMKSKTIPKKTRKSFYHYQKPLETDWKRQKLTDRPKTPTNENEDPKVSSANENSQDSVINVDKDDPQPSPLTEVTQTQPNNSAFYPYVDPLHFFIDLRVSAGQVYDRKKETYLSQALKSNIPLDPTWTNPIIGKNRVGSAFKVPETNNFSAINLIANNDHSSSTKFNSRSEYETESASDKSEDVEVQIFDSDTKTDHDN